jgi:transcriptional regulator with XRE-family HTH domain
MNKSSLRLKKIRLRINLTQKELGDKLGVPWYLIKNIETEKTKLSIEIAEGLYKNLGININWILSGQGSMFLDTEALPPPSEPEEPQLTPEVKKIVYELKEVTEKIKSLHIVREEKPPYITSSVKNKRKYPLINEKTICATTHVTLEEEPHEYVELPEDWNVNADFAILISNYLFSNLLCFIRKEEELSEGNIVLLNAHENGRHELILKKVKYVNGLMEFHNEYGSELKGNFEVRGAVVFFMSDYRTM